MKFQVRPRAIVTRATTRYANSTNASECQTDYTNYSSLTGHQKPCVIGSINNELKF